MCGRIRGARGGSQCIHPVIEVLKRVVLAGEGCGAYHVEGNDIFEGDFAGFVFFDEELVD